MEYRDGEGNLRIIPVEVKGDRYHALATSSRRSVTGKGTAGCFLIPRPTGFYYFVEIGRLYCLPMHGIRPWFDAHMHRFRERRTSTPVARGQDRYITVGRLVPIQTVLDEVPGILQYQKTETGWEPVVEAG